MDLDGYPWPDPQEPRLLDEAARQLREDRGQHFVAPNFGLCLFERAWSLRGFDQLLIDLLERPDWVTRLLDRITEIQTVLAGRFGGKAPVYGPSVLVHAPQQHADAGGIDGRFMLAVETHHGQFAHPGLAQAHRQFQHRTAQLGQARQQA